MVLVLILILLCMFIIGYYISDKDILSPFLISCGMYLLGTIFTSLNLGRWGVSFSPITVLIIIAGLLSVGIGEIFAKLFWFRNNKIKQFKHCNKIIYIPFFISIIVFVFGISISYLTYQKLLEIASYVGYSGEGHLLTYARHALAYYDVSWGVLLPILQFFVSGLAYVFTFALINNIIFLNNIKKAISNYYFLILPIIPFFAIQIMSTGRTGFIKYISTMIFIGIILLEIREGWTFKHNFRILVIGLISLILFYFIFIGAGFLTGKSKVMSIWDNLSIYTGSSIAGLNEFLKNPTNAQYFGEETLYGVRNLLQVLGFNVKTFSMHLEFISFENNLSTNVYSGLRRYIHDYGYFGMLLIQFLLGFTYTFFYSYIKKRNKVELWIIIYSYLSYNLIMQFINGGFLMTFLTMTQIFNILFIVISYSMFIWPFYGKKYKLIKFRLSS